MKVTYIYHSGFLVETEPATLLFDYYKGELPAFPQDKPLIVFASHKHKDHFDFRIFDFINHPGGIYYVFGNDIKLSVNYLSRHGISPEVKEKICRMAAHSVYEPELFNQQVSQPIKIWTLKSTDAGVAFLVRAGKEWIYHAGDLNWWYWAGESEGFNKQQEKGYKEEILYLKQILQEENVNTLDCGFVSLDPRLEEGYRYGMDAFLEEIPVKKVYPMHMWEQYEVIDRYLQACKSEYGNLIKEHSFFTKAT